MDTTALPHVTPDLDEACAALERWGYCLVSEALDPQTTAVLRERLMDQSEAELHAGLRVEYAAHDDGVNQWITMLVNKGEELREIPVAPAGMRLARHLLGEHFLLSVYEAHIVRRGGRAMGLHCDQWAMPMPVAAGAPHPRCGDIRRDTVRTGPPVPAAGLIWPPVMINVMYMITDFTAANGATRIVPGSHLSGFQPDSEEATPVTVEGRAGTALAWDGRTWHAAGLNTTDSARIGLTATYCGPMMRPICNFTIGVRDEVLSAASPALKRLLGFEPWGMYGAVDDPAADVIRREPGRVGRLGRPR